jgi:arsenate reductase
MGPDLRDLRRGGDTEGPSSAIHWIRGGPRQPPTRLATLTLVIQIFGSAKCKVTRAAARFFADRRVPVQMIELREKGISKGELSSVARAVGGMQALFDRSGARVKERGLQYAAPDEARLAVLLQEDPSLLRTPIVRAGKAAAVGDDPAAWKAFAEAAKASG